MRRVLVTGAAGVLGRELVPLIERDGGFALRLTDAVPLETTHEFVRADLARWEEAERLCDGVDEVMHVAAIHPWKPYTPQQYIDCNIKAVWNVLQAAANAGVRRVIYTSSVAAMGYKVDSPAQLPFDESKPCRPVEDIYCVSKHVGEQFCETFRAQKGLPYVALRPGCFIPRPDDDPVFGLGLLTLWLHRSDVAAAHFLALKSDLKNEAILVTAKVPFTRADAPALLADAPPVILRYFPAAARLAERGIQLPKSISPWYNIEKAERLLGYRPRVSFGEWVNRVCGA
jgi:nucleoside-diphosphate-sugar epimerase